MINRIVCAVNESVYYQMLCKGLILSFLKHRPKSCSLTVLLDGTHSDPLDDVRNEIQIQTVKPLNIVCGCVPSRTTFARLEIPSLFSDHERVLYLDVDTYLMRPIPELFTTPFDTAAAVVPGETLRIDDLLWREFGSKLKKLQYTLDGVTHLCGDKDHKYFNAGKCITKGVIDSRCMHLMSMSAFFKCLM